MSLQKILLEHQPQTENLLRVLKQIQKQNKYISKEDCEIVARYFSLSPARVYSAASFFDELKTRKEKKTIIKVCFGGPCLSGKSSEIIRQLELLLKTEIGNDANPKYKLELMSCRGLCDHGPVITVGNQTFESVKSETVDDILTNYI